MMHPSYLEVFTETVLFQVWVVALLITTGAPNDQVTTKQIKYCIYRIKSRRGGTQ